MKEIIPLQQNEEITPIQGYEGLYSITSFGRVWSHRRIKKNGKGKREIGEYYIKPYLNKQGYYRIKLFKEGVCTLYKISRLIAQAFISNPQNLPEVNHKDGNKQNNFAGTTAKNYEDGNLEWCTRQENVDHAVINKLYKRISSRFKGVNFNFHLKRTYKKWVAYVRVNNKQIWIGNYYTEIEAAQAYNDYIIEHGLNRLLNNVNRNEYLRSVEESKRLKRKQISEFKGVGYVKKCKNRPWISCITVNRQYIYLGNFKTEIEAAQAYNNYILEHNLNRSLNKIEEVK